MAILILGIGLDCPRPWRAYRRMYGICFEGEVGYKGYWDLLNKRHALLQELRGMGDKDDACMSSLNLARLAVSVVRRVYTPERTDVNTYTVHIPLSPLNWAKPGTVTQWFLHGYSSYRLRIVGRYNK